MYISFRFLPGIMFVNIPRIFLINVSRIFPAHFPSVLLLNHPGRCRKTIFRRFSLHLPPRFSRSNPRTFQWNIPWRADIFFIPRTFQELSCGIFRSFRRKLPGRFWEYLVLSGWLQTTTRIPSMTADLTHTALTLHIKDYVYTYSPLFHCRYEIKSYNHTTQSGVRDHT